MDFKTLSAGALILLFAQGQPPPAPAGRGAQPAPQPIRPIPVSALTANPDLFVGSPVSLTAAVEQQVRRLDVAVDDAGGVRV